MKYLHMLYPEGRDKAVTFSYDDGCKDDLITAETLARYGMKCTFNLNNSLGNPNKLTIDEVKEYILGKGHEIALHGAKHKAPGVQKPVWGIIDAVDNRRFLEENFDIIVRGMAYPDVGIRNITLNTTYDNVKNYLEELGVVYSRTLGVYNNNFKLPEDWYAWMPTAHHNTEELMGWIDEFLGFSYKDVRNFSSFYPRLMYIWGHSYEFSRDDNWERLEEICNKLSSREDVWYATNIEIYEYVEAYKRLVFSANGDKVYNPTLKTIWFTVDREIFCVKPGETLKIDI